MAPLGPTEDQRRMMIQQDMDPDQWANVERSAITSMFMGQFGSSRRPSDAALQKNRHKTERLRVIQEKGLRPGMPVTYRGGERRSTIKGIDDEGYVILGNTMRRAPQAIDPIG